MSNLLTEDDVRRRLRSLCDAVGGVSAWAKQHGYSPQYVSGVVSGSRPLSPRILADAGFGRETVYFIKGAHHGEEAQRS